MRYICVAILLVFTTTCCQSDLIRQFYTDELLHLFGNNKSLNVDQLEALLHAVKATLKQQYEKQSQTSTNGHDICSKASWVDMVHCRRTKCLDSKSIYLLHNISETTSVNSSTFREICPTLLYQAQNKDTCQNYSSHVAQEKDNKSKGPQDSARVWGFGFLFVTIVNLCSLGGIIVLPFMSKTFYRWLLMFLVALAVGTLAGSSAFFLIPDSFGTPEHDPDQLYIWKGLVICAGIYLFFLIERVLKMYMDYRMAKDDRAVDPTIQVDLSHLPTASVKSHRDVDIDDSLKIPPDTRNHHHHSYGGPQHTASSAQLVDEVTDPLVRGQMTSQVTDQLIEEPEANVSALSRNDNNFEVGMVTKSIKTIAPVAWMIIIGDALHNFVDGLSIGAAFTVSTMAGISVSLAVICEEFPHELGDFAILLNSGMSKWQALGFNFLSALSCYIGLIIGISVGENFGASQWIFALAGGMFLYISLVDMMNDVNHATEEEDFKDCKMRLFLVQNCGLLVGFGAMLLLGLYSGDINLEGN